MNDLQPILMFFGFILLVAFVLSSGPPSGSMTPSVVTFSIGNPVEPAGDGCGSILTAFVLLGGAAFVLLFLL